MSVFVERQAPVSCVELGTDGQAPKVRFAHSGSSSRAITVELHYPSGDEMIGVAYLDPLASEVRAAALALLELCEGIDE